MISIFKKELQSFLGQLVGYIVMGVFLFINGLLFWVMKGYSNVFQNGYADLQPFFYNSAWILGCLLPAITMKSFADEYKNGTIEILKTLPIQNYKIVLGKFLAYMSIVFICLIPSFIYVVSIYKLGNPIGNIDLGITTASYLALLLVSTVYLSIGIFSSMVTKNNISAFILALTINCILYFGFDAIGELNTQGSFVISSWGIAHHFSSVLRGVIANTDIVYFTSLTAAFLGLTLLSLKND